MLKTSPIVSSSINVISFKETGKNEIDNSDEVDKKEVKKICQKLTYPERVFSPPKLK